MSQDETVSMSLHRVRLKVPSGWNRRTHVTLTLKPDESFHPIIDITEDWIPPEVPLVLQRLAERRRRELWRTLPGFTVLQRSEERLAGRMALQLDYTWRIEGQVFRQRHLSWLDGRLLMSVAFSDRDEHFETNLGEFETWLQQQDWDPGATE